MQETQLMSEEKTSTSSSTDKKIPLVEMFGPTIQGEGAVIGQQTYFMRFGLCDYKCKMCDSMNAVDPAQVRANAKWLTQREIYEAFTAFHKPGSTRWITLSGGNPCIHDLLELVLNLREHGFGFAVETQGTFSPDWLKFCSIVTCSPKGPGMGENVDINKLDEFVDRMATFRIRDPGFSWNMKCVVFDQRDLEFAKMMYERYSDGNIPFYLSLGNPYPPGDATKNVKFTHADHMTILVDRYKLLFEDISTDPILSRFRFLPQWHVFVWGNEKGK